MIRAGTLSCRNFVNRIVAGREACMQPQTSFRNTPEKLQKSFKSIIDHTEGPSSAAALQHLFGWRQAMQRFSISLIGALGGILLVTGPIEAGEAKVATTRTERCTNLSRQVDEALETHAAATQVTAAKALQKRANRFCANKKQAQGIRMLANALKLLGVTPIDPDVVPPKTDLHTKEKKP